MYLAVCEGAVGHDAVARGQDRLGVVDVAEDGGEVAEGAPPATCQVKTVSRAAGLGHASGRSITTVRARPSGVKPAA